MVMELTRAETGERVEVEVVGGKVTVPGGTWAGFRFTPKSEKKD